MHQVEISGDIVERLKTRRGRYHLYEKIYPDKTALIVIDMQNAFCKPGAPAEVPASRDIVGNINSLAEALRSRGGSIIWIASAFDCKNGRSDWENFFNYIVAAEVRSQTMEYMAPGAEGVALWEELDAREDDIYVEKNRYSCFVPGASQLERILRSHGIDSLLIAGTKTNICCETTARAAFDMDFKVTLVSDCCAALSDREHLATMENMIQQFGDVMTAQEVTDRLSQ